MHVRESSIYVCVCVYVYVCLVECIFTNTLHIAAALVVVVVVVGGWPLFEARLDCECCLFV